MLSEPAIRQLIADGESVAVEFKIKAPRPAELAERICGMANTRTGGTVIFGVADASRDIIGLKNPNRRWMSTLIRLAGSRHRSGSPAVLWCRGDGHLSSAGSRQRTIIRSTA